MVEAIPKPVMDVWEKWNIRGLVIASLSLQTILILFSPNRKRSGTMYFRFLVWSSYLLANWAADYAVGQISDSQGGEDNQSDHKDLLAFWATFLLLHLGGPDTITALALEDNELWLRSLFVFICQGAFTLYVFLLSIPNRLVVPTSFMLVAGVIKYAERIKALYAANLETLKESMLDEPDPGPDYVKFMEEYEARKNMQKPPHIIEIKVTKKGQNRDSTIKRNGGLTNLEVVGYAYKYFDVFKGLVVDLVFTNQQWEDSKNLFNSLNAEDALRILEVELGFIYDTLFTKVEILHTRIGALFRAGALISLVSSLCIFMMKNKESYDGFDVGLTYALIFGGILLDLVSILMFCFSDWTFARLRKLDEEPTWEPTWFNRALERLLSFRDLKWEDLRFEHADFSEVYNLLDRKFVVRRWSEYVYGYNLIGYPPRIHQNKGFIRKSLDKIIHCLFIDRAFKCIVSPLLFLLAAMTKLIKYVLSFIDHMILHYSKKYRIIYIFIFPIRQSLVALIWYPINYYDHLFGIRDKLNAMMYTFSHRLDKGLWQFIFEEVKLKAEFANDSASAKRISWTRGDWTLRKLQSRIAETDVETLLQHVTEVDYDESILVWHVATALFYKQTEATAENYNHREFSKILSDYMMYLFLVQPMLMSTVAGIDKIRFKEVIRDAKKYSIFLMNLPKGEASIVDMENEIRKAKGYRRKSVLLDAIALTRKLMRLEVMRGERQAWETVSKVWVELLCYAANHCDPKQHAAQLSKGGQLLSFVWLLMSHFGIGDKFQIKKETQVRDLIFGKL